MTTERRVAEQALLQLQCAARNYANDAAHMVTSHALHALKDSAITYDKALRQCPEAADELARQLDPFTPK